MGVRRYHLAGREAPLLDHHRTPGGDRRDFVGYIQSGKVGAFVRADEYHVLFQRHVITSSEFVGQFSSPTRKTGSPDRERSRGPFLARFPAVLCKVSVKFVVL